MQLSRKAPEINLRELIESRLSDYDIYRYYIGHEIHLNTAFKSCLHPDKGKPSMSIGVTRSGHLQWNDYSLDERGSWSDLVMRMYNIGYHECLQKVCKDFGLLQNDNRYQKIISAYKQPVIEEYHRTLIQCTVRKGYLKRDIEYWNQYLITEDDLQKEQIYSLSELYINRHKVLISPQEKVYGYLYPEGRWKIYMPDRVKGEKWKSNIPCSLIEGFSTLNGSPRVVITKSRKDRLCLQHLLQIPVVNTQNEGQSCFTEEVVQKLSSKEVYINYDSDPPGKQNSRKITEKFGYKHINVPDHYNPVKDFADMVAIHGKEKVIEHLTVKGLI